MQTPGVTHTCLQEPEMGAYLRGEDSHKGGLSSGCRAVPCHHGGEGAPGDCDHCRARWEAEPYPGVPSAVLGHHQLVDDPGRQDNSVQA